MQNLTKTKPTEIIAQAAALAQGAERHAATVDLGHNHAGNIRLDVSHLANAIAALNAGNDELRKRRLALRESARENRRFLMTARDTLKPLLGFTYNPAWDTAGMVGSLYIPEAAEEILPILAAFRSYLSTRPELHDENKGITPVMVQARFDALDAAIGAVNSQITTVQNLLAARNQRIRAAQRRIRGTISALKQLLEPTDPRWDSYGLNRPGLKARPDQPTDVTATPSGTNALAVEWSPAARAEYYRLRMKVLGVDTDWKLIGSPADPDFLLENLPPNSTVAIIVSAVNPGGESIPTEVLTVQLRSSEEELRKEPVAAVLETTRPQ